MYLGHFFHGKKDAYFLQKLGWATFWAIFTQTFPGHPDAKLKPILPSFRLPAYTCTITRGYCGKLPRTFEKVKIVFHFKNALG
jgi:hypothetical protein